MPPVHRAPMHPPLQHLAFPKRRAAPQHPWRAPAPPWPTHTLCSYACSAPEQWRMCISAQRRTAAPRRRAVLLNAAPCTEVEQFTIRMPALPRPVIPAPPLPLSPYLAPAFHGPGSFEASDAPPPFFSSTCLSPPGHRMPSYWLSFLVGWKPGQSLLQKQPTLMVNKCRPARGGDAKGSEMC